MASSQCQRNSANKASMQLSYEENARLDEMIKQAEQVCNSEDLVNQSAVVVAEHEGLADGGMNFGGNFKMGRDHDDDQFQMMGHKGQFGQGLNGGAMMGPNGQFGVGQIGGAMMGPKGQFGPGPKGGAMMGHQGRFGGPIGGAAIIGPIVWKIAKKITVVVGTLKASQTRGPLRVFNTKKWAGHIVKNFPNQLNGMAPFTISAMQDKGVKAAVLYVGKNRANTECGWLLAFADTKHGGERVYTECGPLSKFFSINWANIEQKLDSSGSTAKCSDQVTGTSVYATMVGATNKDLLAATFSG